MNEKNPARDIHKIANELGLHKLSDTHLQQLLKAGRVASARRSILQTDTLVPSDEPAHVFRLP